jgi:transcriptional regulator with XRE-family HTH domain
MSDDHQAFADWLKERAARAGYDLEKRGVVSELARDSGNDPGQMSRFLRGQAIPAIEGQRGLAKALGIKLPPVMIAAGSAEPGDFETAEPARPLTLEEAAERMGLEGAERDLFIRSAAPVLEMLESVRTAGARLQAQPKRDVRLRGVGGHPRPQSLNTDEQPGEE